eukprot:gene6779-6996_t
MNFLQAVLADYTAGTDLVDALQQAAVAAPHGQLQLQALNCNFVSSSLLQQISIHSLRGLTITVLLEHSSRGGGAAAATAALARLTNLRHLQLRSEHPELQPALAALTALESLDVGQPLLALSQLRTLSVRNSQSSAEQLELLSGCLTSLTAVTFSYWSVERASEAVPALWRLPVRTLWLGSCGGRPLPLDAVQQLSKIKQLTDLSLSCKVDSSPRLLGEVLSQITQLQELSLWKPELSADPAADTDVSSKADTDVSSKDEEASGAGYLDFSGAAAAAADEAAGDEDEPSNLDELISVLERRLALGDDSKHALLKQLKREPLLTSLDLEGVAQLIKAGKVKRIITMCGAGISVSAGIPDFRTPGSGLYSQLERFGLPEPEAVFSISFFKKNPKPFYLLAKELFPGNYKPTPTHLFIKLLHDKGLLLRCFTQNIDSLEHQAGLPQSAVVAAHGNFDSAHCIKCGKEHGLEHVKEAVFSDSICHCTKCGGLVKPDIVFFGEQLPDRFYERMEYDFPTCDLLLVMGTSLVVHPFASLIDAVPDFCPRVLVNRERVGEGMGGLGLMGSLLGFGGGGGFIFESSEGAYRDVLFLGDTDDGVKQLARLLGWEQELEELISNAVTSTQTDESSSQQSSL